jgi:PTH1 family peptidyl-tRNA hydrolase
MWLVVGLGNPGTKYERNRHNIGFLAVDDIAGKLGASPWAKKFSGELCEAQGTRHEASDLKEENTHAPRITHHESRIYFLKPQTYMNLSGESVGAAAHFYKIPPEKIIVLHDELDLLPGKLRVKQGGGAGGHNGIKSIDAHLGENYHRVRIGIGHPGAAHEVSNYVLSNFSKEEWATQEKMLAAITDNFSLLIQNDAAGFMNKVALHMSPPSRHSPVKGEGEEFVSVFPPPLRGRVRVGGKDNLIPLARTLRGNMTDAEKKLWYHLRRENLAGHKFRRQQPLDDYIADFICLEKKLIIEIDGSQHEENAKADEARSAYLAKTGHKVLRFWNNEVLENIEGVLQTIMTELEAR